jgi:hypothetical protein
VMMKGYRFPPRASSPESKRKPNEKFCRTEPVV